MRPVLHQQHVVSAEDQALRLEVVGGLLILMIICKISFDFVDADGHWSISLSFVRFVSLYNQLSVVYLLGLIILGLGIEQMAASVEILLSLLVVLIVFKVQLCS